MLAVVFTLILMLDCHLIDYKLKIRIYDIFIISNNCTLMSA